MFEFEMFYNAAREAPGALHFPAFTAQRLTIGCFEERPLPRRGRRKWTGIIIIIIIIMIIMIIVVVVVGFYIYIYIYIHTH